MSVFGSPLLRHRAVDGAAALLLACEDNLLICGGRGNSAAAPAAAAALASRIPAMCADPAALLPMPAAAALCWRPSPETSLGLLAPRGDELAALQVSSLAPRGDEELAALQVSSSFAGCGGGEALGAAPGDAAPPPPAPPRRKAAAASADADAPTVGALAEGFKVSLLEATTSFGGALGGRVTGSARS